MTRSAVRIPPRHPGVLSMKAIVTTLLLSCLLLAGCRGGGLSGEYGQRNEISGDWNTVYTFKGDRVEIDLLGNIQVGSFTVEDRKVYITFAGQTQAMRIDDAGCIDGGLLFGRACKKS